eukprot:scaffold172_cov254-Pinguiococcus_pyrenoidosus.AAC.15
MASNVCDSLQNVKEWHGRNVHTPASHIPPFAHLQSCQPGFSQQLRCDRARAHEVATRRTIRSGFIATLPSTTKLHAGTSAKRRAQARKKQAISHRRCRRRPLREEEPKGSETGQSTKSPDERRAVQIWIQKPHRSFEAGPCADQLMRLAPPSRSLLF